MSKRNPTKKAQKTPLDSKNEKLINVLEAMEDRVSIISKQHVIQYANAALEKDFGPATDRKCYEYFRDRKTACPECKDKDVWAGKTVHKEWYSPKNKKTYESTDTPLTNPDGTISMLNILHDITKRKRAEEELRAFEERFRNLAERSFDLIFMTDAQGYLTYISTASEKIFHYKPEEMAGTHFKNYLVKSEIPRVSQHFAENMKGKNLGIFRMEAMRKGGSHVFIELNSAPIVKNGETIGIQGIIRDITERKKAEELLKAEKERAERFLNIVGVMLAIVSADGNVALINKKGCEILGYEEGELIGKNWFDTLVPQRIRDEVREVFHKLVAGDIEPVEYYENPLLTKDGEERLILFHNTVLRDPNGQMVGALTSGEDITERKRMEEALRDSQERLQLAVSGTNLGLWDWNVQTGEAVYNRQWAEMLGYTLEEIEPNANSWKRLVHPGDAPQMMEILNLHFEKKTPFYETEFRMRTKSGGRKYILSVGRVFEWDDDGKPLRMTGTHRDITERKRAEEMLRESEEKYRKLFEETTDAIFVADAETGILTNCNYAASELVGREKSELIGKHQQILHPPQEVEGEFSRTFKQHLKEKEGQVLEAHVITKKGEIRDVAIRANITEFEGKKRVLFGMFRDITERKKAEEALRGSEERYKTLFESSVDGILIADIETRKFEYANPAICRMLGYTEAVLKRSSVDDIHPKENLKHVISEFEAQARGKKTLAQDIPFLRKDGTIMYADINTSKALINGRECNIGFVRDITEHKRLANELKQYKEKIFKAQRHAYIDSMGAIVAHQLNQPLTMINMLLGEALDDLSNEASVPKTVLKNLRESISEAEKTASIISEFRQRVKEQSWDEIGQADVAETATKVTSALTDDAVRANLHITVNPLDGLPTVKCAAAALEQIFFIIIQNAIEAADGEKRHKLTISAKSRDEKVELQFSDDCCGIAPENLKKIFEPFYTTKSDGGGMGLGLEIVRRILIACGGDIRVESDIGRGTTFYVVLSAADSINS